MDEEMPQFSGITPELSELLKEAARDPDEANRLGTVVAIAIGRIKAIRSKKYAIQVLDAVRAGLKDD